MNQPHFLLLLILTLICPSGHVAAQNNDRRVVSGRIVEAFTHEVIPNVSVCLLSASDSTVIETYRPVGGDTLLLNRFGFFQLPVKEKGKYLIRTSCVGFKTQYTPFEVKYKREGDVDVGRIEMKRESMMLGEVTVTGTKIKMVMRGDTVVYNADAFNLAEGSMLDALIRQLPGAELNKDGEIKVNGKKIDNLLVDGRDFFEGDPKAALENLPAYTVNKIKVFDREGKLTEMAGRDMNDKSYVMDVKLKKQYAVSTFGNIEAGAGTEDRYGLRMTASRRAGMHQLSLNANLNNLNDQSSRGFMSGNGAIYYEPAAAQGVQTTRTANVGYSYGGWEDKFSAGISVTGYHNNNHTDTWTSSQTYLAGGDTYSRSANYNRSRSKGFSSYGHLNWSPKQLLTMVSYDVSYSSGNNWGSNRSAQFDADPAEYGDLLDDLFLHPDKYRQLTLNRRETQSLGDNDNLSINATAQTHVKLWADVVSLQADVNYNRTSSNSFQLQDLNYNAQFTIHNAQSTMQNAQSTRDFRNNYTDAPSKNWSTSISADYNVGLGRHNLRLGYGYSHAYNDNENSLYRLDRLPGRDSTSIDLLPSTAEALRSVLDNPNSYNYTRHDNTQNLRASLTLSPRFLGNGGIYLTLPLQHVHKQLDYFRETQQHLTQSHWMLNPNLQMIYSPKHEGGAVFVGLDENQPSIIQIMMNASYQTSVPDIMTLVSYVDNSDPLNVNYSNPDLHKTHTLNLNSNFILIGGPKMRTISATLRYNRTYNAVATSMVYDKTTGRTTTKPVNVDGNWNVGADFIYGQTLDKKKRFRFENSLGFSYNHSVDLNSVAGATASAESIVHNTSLNDHLTANYQIPAGEGRGNHELSLSVSGSLNHVTSSREDFQRINAGNFSYGLSALVQLPWKLQLSTSIVNYSRRGYSDPQMNRDELIWGAKLSRQLLKNTLTVSIEGFDLLGQLSNRQYNINAQGRTETYTNVVSQYGLLKLTYQFRKFPKGKKNADPFFF